jgi:flagellar biosynthesis/type III secretory pathway protein FliH
VVIRRLASGVVLETVERRRVAGGHDDAVSVEPLQPADPADASGYRDGYADGFEAGETDARRMAEQRLGELEEQANGRLEAALRELTGERERLALLLEGMTQALQRHDEAMRELAFEVALSSMATLCGQRQEEGELLRRLCEQMADDYRAKATRICVSPGDRPLLPERIADLAVEAEPGIPDGGCRVVTERGWVESSIAGRLTAIHEAMLETLGTNGA